MKLWVRRASLGSGALFFLLMLLLFAWLTTNMWPRDLETALWTKADLGQADTSEQNAWNRLPRDDSPEPVSIEGLVPEAAYQLIPPALRPLEKRNPQQYWSAVQQLFTKLPEQDPAWQKAATYLQSILSAKQFIDNESPSLEEAGVKRLYLLDLMRFAWTRILQLAIDGQWDQAYQEWSQLWELSREWILSARSLFSNILAIEVVSGNLTVLRLMLAAEPPPDPEALIFQIKSLDIKQLSFERALAYEYLSQTSAIETILGQQKVEVGSLPAAFFNQSLILQELNGHFRQYQEYLQHPEKVPNNTDEIHEEEMADLEAPFWWAYNPGGKILYRLLSVNVLGIMRQYYLKKEELEEQRALVLKALQHLSESS